MKYNKLVRDKIPGIIRKSGQQATTHTANEDEYREKLHEKMREEVDEFLQDPSEEELADVMEVLNAIANVYNLSREKTAAIQKEKAASRGTFDKKVILEETN